MAAAPSRSSSSVAGNSGSSNSSASRGSETWSFVQDNLISPPGLSSAASAGFMIATYCTQLGCRADQDPMAVADRRAREQRHQQAGQQFAQYQQANPQYFPQQHNVQQQIAFNTLQQQERTRQMQSYSGPAFPQMRAGPARW